MKIVTQVLLGFVRLKSKKKYIKVRCRMNNERNTPRPKIVVNELAFLQNNMK